MMSRNDWKKLAQRGTRERETTRTDEPRVLFRAARRLAWGSIAHAHDALTALLAGVERWCVHRVRKWRVGLWLGMRTLTRWWAERPSWFRSAGAARALGAVTISLALTWMVLAPDTTPPDVVVQVQAVEVEDTEVPEWLIAGQEDGGIIAKKMPSKRMKGQQPPPCVPPPDEQHQINEACWGRMEMRPPCGEFYEYEGRCYVPIIEKKRMPTSVEP